jgi:arylsulfatase
LPLPSDRRSAAAYVAPTPWQLFNVEHDRAQSRDVATEHAQTGNELSAAYEKWQASLQSRLVNEHAKGPAENPFKELYWKQFGR